jgi:hypothetical protein
LEAIMPQNPPLVFSSITPAQYAALVAKAKASGVDLIGNSGIASRYGVEISWNYEPESQQLTLQCLKTPFFVKASDINQKLQTLVNQSLTSL